MESIDSEAIGFELGWDYAIASLHPPVDVAHPTTASVLRGFNAGKLHFAKQRLRSRPEDDEFRFERKWLHLRLSAHRRSRSISQDLTPAFLKKVQSEYCPVTRLAFTHGQGLPTDSTIERLNNNGGYAVGNICMLSSVANQAKGSLSFSQVLEVALQIPNGTTHEGLSASQWARLSCLAAYGCEPDEQHKADALPMLCFPLPGCSIGSEFMMVRFLTSHLMLPSFKKASRLSIYKAYKSLGDKKVVKKLEQFEASCQGAYHRAFLKSSVKNVIFMFEDCWENPVLLARWSALVAQIGDRFDALASVLYPLVRTQLTDTENIDTSSWNLETGGYLCAENRLFMSPQSRL